MICHHTGLDFIHVQNVIHQQQQPVTIPFGDADQLRSRFWDPADRIRRNQTQSPANRCQRCPQIVTGGGYEFFFSRANSSFRVRSVDVPRYPVKLPSRSNIGFPLVLKTRLIPSEPAIGYIKSRKGSRASNALR